MGYDDNKHSGWLHVKQVIVLYTQNKCNDINRGNMHTRNITTLEQNPTNKCKDMGNVHTRKIVTLEQYPRKQTECGHPSYQICNHAC